MMLRKGKRILAILLSLSMILSIGSGTVFAEDTQPTDWALTTPIANNAYAYSGGDGLTEATAYEIANSYDLAMLSVNVSQGVNYSSGKFFKMTADIVLNDSLIGTPKVWTPIGVYKDLFDFKKSFKGSFDGGGHTVKGVYTTTGSLQGLFGIICETAIVKNVGVIGSSITGADQVGAVVGSCNDSESTVQNCYSTSAIIGTNLYTGGVVGTNVGIVQNCYNTGKIKGQTDVGGVVGNNAGTVQNCYNTGEVVSTSCVGGIVGRNIGGNIKNCVSLGLIVNALGNVSFARVEGFRYYSGTVTDCFARSDMKIGMDTQATTVKNGTSSNKDGADLIVSKTTKQAWDTWFSDTSAWVLPEISPDGENTQGMLWYLEALPYLKGFTDGTQNPTLPAPLINISGSVKYSNGTSVYGAMATLTSETGATEQTLVAYGGFSFKNMPSFKSYTITVTLPGGGTQTKTVLANNIYGEYIEFTVPTPTAPIFTTTSLADGAAGTAYTQTLAATGYPVPTYSITAGSLPTGLTLSTDGKITGTPTESGKFDFTVSATNAYGSDTKEFSITVTSPLVITLPNGATSLDFGSALNNYTAIDAKTVTITNSGTDSVTLAQPSSTNYTIGNLSKATLAKDETATFTVAPKTGLAANNYDESILIKVGASGEYTYGAVNVKFNVTVPTPAAPKFTTTSLANGAVATPYTQTLATTGYPVPTYSITAGSLPAGLTLSTDGKITGTPTESGKFDFTVKATNANGSDIKAFSITVNSTISSITVTPANTTVKKTKTQKFTANVTGIASDKSVIWSVNSTNSSIDADGLLSVGLKETAATLTVKAISTADSNKFATAIVTVTAAPKICTVTFNNDGGTPASVNSDSVEEGKTIPLPNTPTKANYRFDGWYTAKNGSGTMFTSSTIVTDSITVYAKWTKLVTVAGIVVESDKTTPISGAKITLNPTYSTSEQTTGADGKFSFANIPEESLTITATFDDTSTLVVNVIDNYDNVKIIKPAPNLVFTKQPADLLFVKGLTTNAQTQPQTTRTPNIKDSVGMQWYWKKGTSTPNVLTDTRMKNDKGQDISGNLMNFDEIVGNNNNVPERGIYQFYAYAYDIYAPIDAYSRVATLKVVGTNTIEGVVKKGSTPIENAKVELVYAGGAWPYGSVAIAKSTNQQTTAADGKYKFELVPDGNYKLIITLPDGGIITDGPYNFPTADPNKPIDIVIPDNAEIRVNAQLQDATVKNGTVVNLTVDASATDDTKLTYQWYKATNSGGSDSTAIYGATANTYSPSTTDKGTTYYYCVVSGGSLTKVTTRTAKVTVFTYGVIAGTVQTKDKQPIEGAKVELINIDTPVKTGFTTSQNPQITVTDGKYKFIEVPDGTYKLKITLPGDDNQIFVVEPINVPNVNPDIPAIQPDKPTINITSQPKSLTVALNDTAEFSVKAGASNGGTVLYQWYSNTTNSKSGGIIIDGATNSTYRAPSDTKGVSYYYCVMNATEAIAVTSNIAKLTVRNTSLTNLMTIEGDVVDDNGDKVKDATVSLSPKNGTTENPQTTNTDGHYKFGNLPDGKYIITVQLPSGGIITKEIIIDDGEIAPKQPSNIDVPSKNTITITKQPENLTLTTEMSASLIAEAAATKSGVTYQWYKNALNINFGGTKLDGKTSSTLDLGKQPEGESYYYCVVSSDKATDTSTKAVKLTVTKEEGNVGDIGGSVVSDDDNNPIVNVEVKLMKNGTDGIQFGSTVITNDKGEFKFTAVPYGSYSLVATKNTQIVTKQIAVKSANTTENLIMPSGNKLTKVEVKTDTPSTAVKNLEELFTSNDNVISEQMGATVEIKLIVEKKDNPADKEKIDAALSNQTVGIYLDARLVKTISGTIADNSTENIQPPAGQSLKMVLDLSEDLQGKEDYRVIRSHEGIVSTIIPVLDTTLQTLTFDADSFSTYAIVYASPAAPIKYSLTVIGSQAGAGSGSGLYDEGKIVTIKAGSKSSYNFNGWTSSDNVIFENKDSENTTFTMPANSVIVTANWKTNGGGNENTNNDDSDDHLQTSSSSSSQPSSSSTTSSSAGNGSSQPSSSSTASSSAGNGSSGNVANSKHSSSSSSNESSSNSISDNKPSDPDISEVKDNTLIELAKKREETIASIPDTIGDKQRQALIAEIDKIYNVALKAIQGAGTQKDISAAFHKATNDFANVLENLAITVQKDTTEGTKKGGKPFVLLSLILALIAVLSAFLSVLKKRNRTKQITSILAAVFAVVILICTSGFSGFAFANLWTIAIAVLAAVSALAFLVNAEYKKDV